MIADRAEHLHDRIMLELLNRLLRPVGSDEREIRVNRRNVFGGRRQTGNPEVDQVLLDPKLIIRADLDVMGIALLRHLEGASSERALHGIEDRARIADMLLKRTIKRVAGPVSCRIKNHGDDVKAIRERLKCRNGMWSLRGMINSWIHYGVVGFVSWLK